MHFPTICHFNITHTMATKYDNRSVYACQKCMGVLPFLTFCTSLYFMFMCAVGPIDKMLNMKTINNHTANTNTDYNHNNKNLSSRFMLMPRRLQEQKLSRTLDLNMNKATSDATDLVNISNLSDFGQQMFQSEGAIGYYDFMVPLMRVPLGANVYVAFCINLNNITHEIKVINPMMKPNSLKKIVIIGFEPYRNRHDLVHHYDLIGSDVDYYDPTEQNFEKYKCSSGQNTSLPNEQTVWIWIRDKNTTAQSVRDKPYIGSNVFGSSSATRTLKLKIHYQNGRQNPYLLDRTGVRIYFNYSYTNTCPNQDQCQPPFSLRDFIRSLFGRKQSSYFMSNPTSIDNCKSSCVKQEDVITRKEMKYVCGNRCT